MIKIRLHSEYSKTTWVPQALELRGEGTGSTQYEKDEINVPIALSAFRDGDQGPSKVTKTELLTQYEWRGGNLSTSLRFPPLNSH